MDRRLDKYEQWQMDYIKEHYQDKLTDIAQHTGINERRIGEIIKALGIERERYWKIYLPKTPEVEEELRNPYLSHVELARKYNVTETCIAKRRQQLGVGVRRKNYDTLPEQEVANILDSIDLVYSTQKRIDKWSIDFYLGRKYCIDVHGHWAHSKEKVKERDERKEQFMRDNGYYYLVIHEEELLDADAVENKIRNFVALGFPLQ